MAEFMRVLGFLIGVLSIAAVALLLVAGVAFAFVKREQDGDL